MNLSEFEELLDTIDFLEVEGELISEKPNPSNAHKASLFQATIAELRSIDARLPASIEGQLAVTKVIMSGKPVSTIYARLLKRTLMVWRSEQMIETLEAGAIPYEYLVEIDAVELSNNSPQLRLTLYGSRVHDFTSAEGVTVKLAERTLKETYTISSYWLEDNYPGWQNRYLVASSLGYTEAELVAHTLPENLPRLNRTDGVSDITFE